MEIVKTEISGVFILKSKVHKDEQFFNEIYNNKNYMFHKIDITDKKRSISYF